VGPLRTETLFDPDPDMKRFRWSAAILAALIPGLTGCIDDDSSTGPVVPGGLDAEAVVVDMDALLRPLQEAAPAAANLEQAYASLAANGMVFGTTPPDAALRGDGPTSTPLAVEIPGGLLGTTFTYVRADAEWQPDESRTDAPSDAVRVIWYELDGTGLIAVPLVEQGYIDLTDERDDPSLDRLGVLAVDDLSGAEITVLDFDQGYESTTGTLSTEYWDAAGYYGDGTTDVSFSVMSDETTDPGTADETSELEVTLQGPEAFYSLTNSGTVDGATGDTEDQLRATVTVEGVTTVVDVTLTGTLGSSVVDVTGTLTHGGTAVASISSEGGAVRFTDPDGDQFSGSQATVLSLLYRTLLGHGLVVIEVLPLYFR
jgi:hypothetical protein